jgi:hypothetical protein
MANFLSRASKALRGLLDGDDDKPKLGKAKPELHRGPSNPTSTPQGPASSRSQGLPKLPPTTYGATKPLNVKTPEGAARIKGAPEVSHEQRQRLDMARVKADNPKDTPKQLLDKYTAEQLKKSKAGKQSAIREA